MRKKNISTFRQAQSIASSMQENYEEILAEIGRYVQAVGYSPMTQKSILGGVLSFLKWLESEGITDIKKVKYQNIKVYHEYLKNRPNKTTGGALSSSMILNYLWAVRLLFAQQEQCGKLSKNIMSGYPLPKAEHSKRNALSVDEIQELYRVCETVKERIILHLYYGLGLRRCEGEALNIKDVDFKNGWLYVLKGKGGKGRNMPLTPSIQADFKSYLLSEKRLTPNTAFLLNEKQTRLKGYTALIMLRRLLKRAKIQTPSTGSGQGKIDLHCLRHSIATHLINSGMEVEQVRNYLGHSQLETTQNYIHDDPTRVFTSKI